MSRRNLIESFNCAIEGFIYCMKTQRNMRLHFLIASIVLILGFYLNLTRIEFLVLCGSISLVLLAEMFNTVAEHTVDLLNNTFHPLTRIIKDISAGGVLVASINACIVGYLVFSRHIKFPLENTILRVKSSSGHISLICLISVLCLVVVGKVLFHKGRPLRGGMPSGHSAVAFCFWTIIALTQKNTLVIILGLIMSLMVAFSRLENRIHTVWEVITGSALGISVTTLAFQILG